MNTLKTLSGWTLRTLEQAIIASLVAGLIIGLLARVAMTALTLGGGRSNEFAPLVVTLHGVVRIATFPMLFGIPLVFLLVAFWRNLPGSGWAKAISAGVATFVFPGLLLLTSSSFHINDATRYLGTALFAPLHFAYGFLAGLVIDASNTRAPGDFWARWKLVILPASLIILGILYVWSDSLAFSR